MVTAYFVIKARHGKVKLVFDRLNKYEQIIEMDEVFGRYDLICKVQTDSQTELKEFIQNKVWITEDIKRCETLLVATDEEYSEVCDVPKNVPDFSHIGLSED